MMNSVCIFIRKHIILNKFFRLILTNLKIKPVDNKYQMSNRCRFAFSLSILVRMKV
jgi:hypothetical protein